MSAVSFTWTQDDLKEEFHALFDNSPLGWVHCDRQGAVVAVNLAVGRILGLAKELEGSSSSLIDLIHSSDRGETQRLVFELLDGRRNAFQTVSCSASGQQLRWSVWGISTRHGAMQSVLAVVGEYSSLLTADHFRPTDRLEAVGRLAGGIAHDFNNLLTGILLYCDLLLANVEPGHRARKYAEEIRKAGLQASGLVRQLLAVARPPTFQPRLLSLNEIAESMRNLLVRLIGESIELKFCLDANLGLVKMDSTQAQQILLNLVLNARDAMPHGGEVTVETHNCKLDVLTKSGARNSAGIPCALLVVADTGRGMDASTRAHLFEPFFTTKAGKGTGLGLATVHDIVTSNGGLIHAESELNQGTRFSVLLPLMPEALQGLFNTNCFHSDFEKKTSSKEEE